MKLIFVTSESMLDHSYTMIRELRNHVELTSYIIAKEKSEELKDFCRDLNSVFVQRYSFKNPLSMLKERKLFKELKNKNADLIWFDRTTFYQTLLLKNYLKNYLINIHDVDLHPEEKDKHGIWTQKLIFKRHRNRIAVMSRTQAAIFEKLYGIKPFLLQLPIIDYYGVVTPLPKREPKPGDKVKFFFFGSVLPYKGLENLIEAAGILSSKGAEFELNIYGKLKYNEAEFTERISQNKNITLVDKYVDYKEVSSVFSSNDVLVIPYIQVSQCGPLLIAYSYNTPVICSDLDGFKEYVDENKSGLLFSSSAGLAEMMEQIIKDPAQIGAMSAYINKEIHDKFSMQSFAGSYVSEFKKAAGI